MSKVKSLSHNDVLHCLDNEIAKPESSFSDHGTDSYGTSSITYRNLPEQNSSNPRQQRVRGIKSYSSNCIVCVDYFAATLRAKTYFSPNEKGLLREIKESYFYTLTEQLQDEQAIQIGDHILMVRQNWNGKEDKPKGSEFYSRIYDIYLGDHGEPFAQLLTLPNDRRGALLPYDYCEIKINNWEFYRENGDGAGWCSKLVYLLSELNLEINSIVRIDIALDGEHLLDVYRRRIEKRDIELLGRSKKEQWCNGWGENGLPAVIESEKEETGATKTILHGGRMTGFYMGSGGKSLCGYLKWQRIEADDKFYIAECAKLNGVGEKFERLELRLKNDNIRTIPGFEQPKETMKIWNDTKNKYVRREYRHPLNLDSILKLQESGFLASIMKSQFNNWFEFVPIKGDSKKSRRKTIEFIDWKRLEATELQRLSVVRKPSDVWLSERTGKGLITFAENPAIVEYVRRELPKYIAETMDNNEVKQLIRSVGFGIAEFHHRRDWLEKQDAKIDRRSKEVKISLKGE